ncbi:hypothetical protein O181_064132 [Austropuccinia psidii MF-1]|uniref:Integrase catalytic domain-containing protein n=1 Tax=Austropuccinia psidii MF-1 TaxID=1389203 RepID=A0A9Q3EV69_9BASI|nr:hypothetical protein [Austropuccinia psidii MF-1]
MSQLPFKNSFKKTNHVLESVHLDLCGPFQTPSLAGAKYFLIIVDQLSGFITTKFLKNKNDCFNHFQNFKLAAENLQETKIKKITTDGGGEFVNKSFKNHCTESGIEHIIRPPYTPQHNPLLERRNRSVLEKARCILLQSKLPLKYWAEAISTATFLCNLIPKHEDHITPYKIWHKSKPSLNKLRPFGCKAWIKIPKNFITNKFAPKAWDGILLGYENNNSERESINSQPEDNSHNIKLAPSDNEDEDSVVDALEQQPQPERIKVIGHRHPTLISSEINNENILPFCRRQPRTNTPRSKLI